MSTPEVKAPTKKASRFPKGAADKAQAEAKSDRKTANKKADAETAATKRAPKKPAAPASEPKNAKKQAPKAASAKPKAKQAVKAPEVKTPEPKASAPAAENVATPAVKADAKARRVKKEKVVRDSFTMPKSDYAKLATLKQKCLDKGVRVRKSELLRAALALLDEAPEKRLLAAIKSLEPVKTGRPANA